MKYKIKTLKDSDDELYEKFIIEHNDSMFYHSLKYKKMLLSILKDTMALYLGAFDKEKLVGVLPSISKESIYGCVINSLPFYGSNGGLLTLSDNAELIKKNLLDAIYEIAKAKNCLSTVLIDSSISNTSQETKDISNLIIFDERYSQITFFDNLKIDNIESSLMNIFHSKTRNMVRKSLKSNIKICHGCSEKYFNDLIYLHRLNSKKLNGKAKPDTFFEFLMKKFEYDKDYRIYTATMNDGRVIASLLIFYFKDQVEYFIPAIDDNYKDASEVSEPYLLDAMRSVFAGESVKVSTTDAIGCSIKRIKK